MYQETITRKSSLKFRGFFMALCFIIVFGGCRDRSQRFNMDVAVDVTVQAVEPGPIQEKVTVTGDLMPASSATLTNEMRGAYFLQTNPETGSPFKMGDFVKEGTVIVRLEDKAFRNSTDIEGERLNLEIARQEYTKLQALFEKGGATRRELVNAEKNQVTAEKTYENAQINLDKMSIEAPFDGVITSLPYYSNGVRVDEGKEIAALMNFDRLILDVTFPAAAFGRVSPNQKVLITNYASSEDTVIGKVSQLSPVLDVDTRSFKGRISIFNENKPLRPGMFVNAGIIVQQKDSVLSVPSEIVLSQMGGSFVFVAEGESARKRIVQTGLEGEDRIEIVDGLEPGEQVVVKGVETLKDGSRIKLQ